MEGYFKRQVKISGTGKYLPKRVVLSSEIDQKFSLVPGTIEKKSGIHKRHCADISSKEDIVSMSTIAALQAVENAGLSLDDIDCIVFAGGTPERLIPCTASLIHKELGLYKTNIPAFDINSTCLSFLVAFDHLSYLVSAGKYKHVLIVSADIPNMVMNPKDLATYIIFGDGAAAAVISKTPQNSESCVLHSLMQTHSLGAPYCDLRLGSAHIPQSAADYHWENYTFHMDGKSVYKLIGEALPSFLNEFLSHAKLHLSDIDVIIPHQASNIAMQAFSDILGKSSHKLVNIYPDYGNQVAASVPTAMHEAIMQKRISPGSKVMLLGTSAGVSLSAVVFQH
jgi:3-oxoacyl-[acyl-carrier-protein] synthase-3